MPVRRMKVSYAYFSKFAIKLVLTATSLEPSQKKCWIHHLYPYHSIPNLNIWRRSVRYIYSKINGPQEDRWKRQQQSRHRRQIRRSKKKFTQVYCKNSQNCADPKVYVVTSRVLNVHLSFRGVLLAYYQNNNDLIQLKLYRQLIYNLQITCRVNDNLM